MRHLKQCVAWWCFVPSRLTPEAFIAAVADAGYEGIELAPPAYWGTIREHGLRIASIAGHDGIINGLNRTENYPRIEAELRANLQLAAEWHIPNVICFSGSRAGLPDVRGAANTAQNLRKLAPLAESAGVTLVLELLNSKVDHPDYQCDHTAWGVSVIEMVQAPNVRLLYDIYHMQIMEGDIIRTIQAQYRHFGHYHTAGNPGRHEIDTTQELNYPAIARAIAATGYEGYLGQEFIPLTDPIQALRAAHDLCDVSIQ
jgi:hydroxypyruvate isomerase